MKKLLLSTINFKIGRYAGLLLTLFLLSNTTRAQTAVAISKPASTTTNAYYVSNKAPLTAQSFVKLPLSDIKPGGWLKKQLELQRDGLTGHLGEISIWLTKTDNAWINKDRKGKYGWEELPYWLKGYGDIAYVLQDERMLKDTKFWIEAVLNNQQPDGDFGPIIYKGEGKRDLWSNMPMLWCLQSYYEYSKDSRVLTFMSKYFKWELAIPDDKFLEDYWENSRGGDNMVSVYWLYNRTGESWLLDLATKLDRNTANWKQKNNLPNWHNVNVAECFREPATYYQQSHDQNDLEATYNDFKLIRNIYGQVPGGMFGADENARKGYDDPRQAVETCGMVEQMTSDEFLLQSTGDTFWADNCEDVAFNTFPAAFTTDYKALRYLTAPNMVVSDDKNHSPGIANAGPFLAMNPFSSRCCQHNHAAGWIYYSENSWMATADNGLATQLYTEGEVTAKAGNGTQVKITEHTYYPFDGKVNFMVSTEGSVSFPFYFRIPAWCNGASVSINGKNIPVTATPGGYIMLTNKWKNGDQIALQLPMALKVREWQQNKNSISVNYGPLTFSLKIAENYVKIDGKTAVQDDSGWQNTADQSKWPAYSIYAASNWNYGLLVDQQHPEQSFKVLKKSWPKDDNPFTNANAPIELMANGKQIPGWTIDQYGLCGILPVSPVKTQEKTTKLTLVPMGGARLRISAFPVVE
jgi:hypothetical protein